MVGSPALARPWSSASESVLASGEDVVLLWAVPWGHTVLFG